MFLKSFVIIPYQISIRYQQVISRTKRRVIQNRKNTLLAIKKNHAVMEKSRDTNTKRSVQIEKLLGKKVLLRTFYSKNHIYTNE